MLLCIILVTINVHNKNMLYVLCALASTEEEKDKKRRATDTLDNNDDTIDHTKVCLLIFLYRADQTTNIMLSASIWSPVS